MFSSNKLCLASLPVISHFNKISGFAEGSLSSNLSQYNFEASKGSFGHKVMKIETVHGDCSIVKEPLFRNNSSGLMAFVDLDHVSYRPLNGNGVNRDTSITTNVQQADEDLRIEISSQRRDIALMLVDSLKNYRKSMIFDEAIDIAKESIDSGKAKNILEKLSE